LSGPGRPADISGGRLAKAGRDVTFLVRPARADVLRNDGLQIVSPHGDFSLKPQLVTAGNIGGPFDTVLVTVKGFALDRAIDDFAPAVGPETMILPVLNGMKHVDALIARFGERPVAGCVCKVATIVEDGRIVQLSKLQDIAYGEMDGSVSARMKALDAFMQGAGFDTRLSTTIVREMWEKWILLAAMGGINCLMRGTIGEIAAAPGGVDFALAFLDEVVAVVNAVGQPPSEAFLAVAKATLTAKGSPRHRPCIAIL
jgi:2-dehydropantoate 2-reductase